jgi:hypothetical protein
MSSKKPMLTIVSGTCPRILTLLICRSTVLHTGLRHILANTPFALVDDAVDPTSDVSAFRRG